MGDSIILKRALKWYEAVDCIQSDQKGVQLWVIFCSLKDLWFRTRADEFLANLATTGLSI
jgi:hypothetical protein